MFQTRGVLRVIVLLLVGLAVPAAHAPGTAAQATPVATDAAGEQYTPVLQSVPSPPRWFTGSDGRVHLVYELFLANAFPVPVTVTAVEVLATDTGATVASLEGDRLTAAMSLVASPTAATAELPPSSIGVIWFDLPFDHPDEVPPSIRHRLTVSVPPGLPVPDTITSTSLGTEVDRRPPIVIGPPLAGPRWAAMGSCCDGPHRRAYQPIDGGLYLGQRFAIDFNALDEAGRLATGDLNLNESYPSFGQPVLAVADAVVVTAVDRFPDQIPNDPRDVTLESADGNHVILDLGDGRYAFYAHLKAGSVTVRDGDTVERGQQIGELGNSGSSTGPHLHFHVMDAPTALVADGMPYVFDQVELEGRTPPLEETIEFGEGQEPIPLDTATAGPRDDELPLGRDVVGFPEAPPTN
jgi:hypothetical protein